MSLLYLHRKQVSFHTDCHVATKSHKHTAPLTTVISLFLYIIIDCITLNQSIIVTQFMSTVALAVLSE